MNDRSLILFFHGNAQNISAHYKNLEWVTQFGHDFIIFDYRGYGLSSGESQPDGIIQDSIVALKETEKIYNKEGYKQIIIYGQSLGGALALKALEDYKKLVPSLLFLDSTFTSYKKIAADKLMSKWWTWPIHPLAYLLISDRQSPSHSLNFLSKIPTLVTHGDADNIIPIQFGEDIFKRVKSSQKTFWRISGGKHIQTFFTPDVRYRQMFANYLSSGDFVDLIDKN